MGKQVKIMENKTIAFIWNLLKLIWWFGLLVMCIHTFKSDGNFMKVLDVFLGIISTYNLKTCYETIEELVEMD